MRFRWQCTGNFVTNRRQSAAMQPSREQNCCVDRALCRREHGASVLQQIQCGPRALRAQACRHGVARGASAAAAGRTALPTTPATAADNSTDNSGTCGRGFYPTSRVRLAALPSVPLLPPQDRIQGYPAEPSGTARKAPSAHRGGRQASSVLVQGHVQHRDRGPLALPVALPPCGRRIMACRSGAQARGSHRFNTAREAA